VRLKPRYLIDRSIWYQINIKSVRCRALIKTIINPIVAYKMVKRNTFRFPSPYFIARARYNLFHNIMRPRINVPFQNCWKKRKRRR